MAGSLIARSVARPVAGPIARAVTDARFAGGWTPELIVSDLALWFRGDTNVRTGGARQFTAANSEYLSHADSAFLSVESTDFVVMFFVRFDALTGPHSLVSKWSGGEYVIRYLNASNVFNILGSGLNVNASTFGAASTDTWYLVVAGVNDTAGNGFIGINGGTIDTGGTPTLFASSAAFEIGRHPSTDYTDGRIARVYFAKGAKATSIISDLAAISTWYYNNGNGRTAAAVNAHATLGAVDGTTCEFWSLNEASGNAVSYSGSNDLTDNNTVTAADGPAVSIAEDLTSNDNHGVLTNFATPNSAWKDSEPAALAETAGSLEFDGTDDYVDVGTGPSTVKTISMWLYPHDITTRNVLDIDGTDQIQLDANGEIWTESFPTNSAARQFTKANSEYLSHADSAFFSVESTDFVTFSFVRFDSLTAEQTVLGKWSGPEYVVRNLNADKHFNLLASGVNLKATEFGAASADKWYLVVAGINDTSGNGFISVNAGTIQTGGTPTLSASAAAFEIGRHPSTNYLDGRIARVYFAKGAKATSIISDLAAISTWYYNSGNGRTSTEVNAHATLGTIDGTTCEYWQLDEASGNALSYSGSNDLTDNNTVTNGVGPAGATVYVNGTESDGPLTANAWNHVAITDSTGVNASDFDIGRAGASNTYDGLICDVRLYSDVKTAAEVSALNSGTDNQTNIVGQWPLNDGPQTPVTDGDPVIQWGSKEENDYVQLQDTSAKRPTARTGANGVNQQTAIQLDGTDDLLAMADKPITATEDAVSIAFETPSTPTGGGDQVLFASSDEAGVNDSLLIGFDNTGKVFVESNEPGANRVTGGTVLTGSTAYVLTVETSGSAWTVALSGVDETLAVTGSNTGFWFSDLSGADNTTIGALKNTTENSHADAKILEVVAYPKAQAISVENYLRGRYNI